MQQRLRDHWLGGGEQSPSHGPCTGGLGRAQVTLCRERVASAGAGTVPPLKQRVPTSPAARRLSHFLGPLPPRGPPAILSRPLSTPPVRFAWGGGPWAGFCSHPDVPPGAAEGPANGVGGREALLPAGWRGGHRQGGEGREERSPALLPAWEVERPQIFGRGSSGIPLRG